MGFGIVNVVCPHKATSIRLSLINLVYHRPAPCQGLRTVKGYCVIETSLSIMTFFEWGLSRYSYFHQTFTSSIKMRFSWKEYKMFHPHFLNFLVIHTLWPTPSNSFPPSKSSRTFKTNGGKRGNGKSGRRLNAIMNRIEGDLVASRGNAQ